MNDNVISVLNGSSPSGMSPGQFRKVDQMFCMAASKNILSFRSVDCDFDNGVMTITLSKSEQHAPAISFVARKVGPKTTMFELYIEGKGRAEKSVLFERVFESYRRYVTELIESE